MKISIFAALGLALLATAPAAAEAPQRTRSAIVYGDEPCPQSTDEEIVVCAREPEADRYRIPRRFRGKPKDDVASQSWGSRVATLEEASRPSRPNSCSVVGTGGQTGCTAAMLRAWFDERRATQARQADIP